MFKTIISRYNINRGRKEGKLATWVLSYKAFGKTLYLRKINTSKNFFFKCRRLSVFQFLPDSFYINLGINKKLFLSGDLDSVPLRQARILKQVC